MLEALYSDLLRDGLARSTASRFRDSLSVVFAWAVREQIIVRNTVTESRIPKGQAKLTEDITPFTGQELASTIRAQRSHNPRLADVTEFVSLTGLRWGELTALRVKDVVYEPYPSLLVSRSNSDGYEVKAPKSGRTRRIPLVERAEQIAIVRSAGRGADEPLFAAAKGGVMSEANFKRDVRWDATNSGHRFHDLRHTAATRWLHAGVDVKTVATWLGHSSAAVTLRIYAHHMGTSNDLAALAILKTPRRK